MLLTNLVLEFDHLKEVCKKIFEKTSVASLKFSLAKICDPTFCLIAFDFPV